MSGAEPPHDSGPAGPLTYRWVILGVAILAYATSQFARQNYAGVQKFIAQDLALDKAALGLLGAVFFYSYALFQMPWGFASDRFGSRSIAVIGILLTAASMWGFATGETPNALLFWRALMGIGGAAAYVSLAGGLARWFPPRERGFSQSALGGVGGGLGESAAFFLLPVIAIYFVSGWRPGMRAMAIVIAVLGLLCLALLRSAPPTFKRRTPQPFSRRLLRDPQLWSYTLLFAAFIIGIRIVQPWIAVYAADLYIARHGLDVNAAVIGGGTLVIVAYSVLGRGAGCPLAGKISDALLQRGIARTTIAIAWLAVAMALFWLLAAEPAATWSLSLIALLLGTSINLFTLISAAISDTYGAEHTASIVSFVNTVAQLAGATALAMSGYMGISLSAQAGNALAEYRGVWLTAMTAVGVVTMLGAAVQLAIARRWIAGVRTT